MNVQRWTFERGNYQILVDNAWHISFGFKGLYVYSQERISVSGEKTRDRIEVSQPFLVWRTVFEDTILDRSGELKLDVQWRSGLMNVSARLLIDKENNDWTDVIEEKWTGAKGEWPGPDFYDEYSKLESKFSI